MTNTILDDAEARIAPAAAMAKATRTAIVEGMKDEIGRSHYDRAKIELPKLKKIITEEVHPYLSRLSRLSQHAPRPLPQAILAHVNELHDACVNGTLRIQEGLQEWDQLVPPFVQGRLELDVNRRNNEVGGIRIKLNNWDGKESRLRHLMAYIDQFIRESGWPAAQAAAGTIVPARQASSEIVVERAI